MKGIIKGEGDRTTYWIDGKQVAKATFDAVFPDVPIGTGAGLVHWKDQHCEALAVHPDQREEAMDSAVRKGVPTYFDENGCPVFTSRSHRRAYHKAYGFFDRDAGYSDRAPDLPKPPEPEWADV